MLLKILLGLVIVHAASASDKEANCKFVETHIPPFYHVVYYSPGKKLNDWVTETFYRSESMNGSAVSKSVSIPYQLKTMETLVGAGELDPIKTKSIGAPAYSTNNKLRSKGIARGSLVRMTDLNSALFFNSFKADYTELQAQSCINGKFTVLYQEPTQASFVKLPSGISLARTPEQGLLCNHSLIRPGKSDPLGRGDTSDIIYLSTDDILVTQSRSEGINQYKFTTNLKWISKDTFIRPYINGAGNYVAHVCKNQVRYLFDGVDYETLQPLNDLVLMPLNELDGRIRPVRPANFKKMIDVRDKLYTEETVYLGRPSSNVLTSDKIQCTPDNFCHLPGVVGDDVLKTIGWQLKDFRGTDSDIKAMGPTQNNVCYVHYTNDKPISKHLNLTSTLWMRPEVISNVMDFSCRWKNFCNSSFGHGIEDLQCVEAYKEAEKRCFVTKGFDYNYLAQLQSKERLKQKLTNYETNYLVGSLSGTSDCRSLAERDLNKCQMQLGDNSTRCIMQLGDAAHPSLAQSRQDANYAIDVNGHEKHVLGTKIDIRLFSHNGIFAPKKLVRDQIDYQLTANFLCWAWEDPSVEEIVFDYKGTRILEITANSQSPWMSIYDYVTSSESCIVNPEKRKQVKEWLDWSYKVTPRAMTSHDDHIDIKFRK